MDAWYPHGLCFLLFVLVFLGCPIGNLLFDSMRGRQADKSLQILTNLYKPLQIHTLPYKPLQILAERQIDRERERERERKRERETERQRERRRKRGKD